MSYLCNSGKESINLRFKDYVSLYYTCKDNWNYNSYGSPGLTDIFYYKGGQYGYDRVNIKFNNYFDYKRAKMFIKSEDKKSKKKKIFDEQMRNYEILIKNIKPSIEKAKLDGERYVKDFEYTLQNLLDGKTPT